MIAAIAFVLCTIVAFFISEWVIAQLAVPIDNLAAKRGEDVALTFTTITGAFDLRLRIAIAIGLILSGPIWIWQLWAYVMPAMKKNEKVYTVSFVAAAIPLFFGGVYTGWIVLPHIIEVMASFVPEGVGYTQYYTASYYWDFAFKLFLTVGVSFVLPVFLVALNLAGLMSGRSILKGWRIAVLVSAVFAAVATPGSDIISMLLLAGILVVLYLLAAGVALFFDWRRRKRAGDLFDTELVQ